MKNKKKYIVVEGAKVNNLKNVSVDIPKNKFVVITGLSGSGKSSLAFDTIFAEGNRRYMEGMSSYARSVLDVSSRPNVNDIKNLNPPISIDQKSVVRSPRSTVGTLTEIYDYLRILFAHKGIPHCPECGVEMHRKNIKEIVMDIKKMPDKTNIAVVANYNKQNKDTLNVLKKIKHLGYARVYINKKIITVEEAIFFANKKNSNYEVGIVIDRIVSNLKNFDEERILDSVETAMKIGNGLMKVVINNKKEFEYSKEFVCKNCKVKVRDITARHFSFNSPEGACKECSGLGEKKKINIDLIMPNKKLSISEGGIKPLGGFGVKNGNRQIMTELKKLSGKIKFSMKVPLEKIASEKMKIILFGESGENGFGGVVNILESRYKNTNSEHAVSEIEKYMKTERCVNCHGKRLKKEYLSVLLDKKSIADLVEMDIVSLEKYLEKYLNKKKVDKIEKTLIREILDRLKILNNIGLGYLSLSRGTQTISGGEAQRIRLATQIKSKLTGIIYVLDEPSIGLHSRDNQKLIKTIKRLRDADNSLLVVEHDRDFIKSADWIIDMGKGAGEEGGEVIFEGSVTKMLSSKKSNTAKYLKNEKKVFDKVKKRGASEEYLEIVGAEEHNLKKINIKIPLKRMVVVCGVSGSGKSTLVNDILAKSLNNYFYNTKEVPGKHKKIRGIKRIKKIINITQSPIGKTPRSNAVTYTGVFAHIRKLFAETEDAKNRKYSASRFSFNMRGGRCETCQGDGKRKIEMQLMPNMYVKCETCNGTRYNKKTLEIEYQGVNIAEVLQMTVSYALRFFKKHPLIYKKLKTMEEVGLGYLKLGQSAIDLSGGEAQRIKLATELARKSMGKTIYILDEPTVGLHFEDINRLLKICNALVEKGNTVLIVEHNIDVINSADWIIELGPDGGKDGGNIVFEGIPEDLKKTKTSPTGKFL